MPYLEAERRIFYRCWDCPGAAADVIFLHGAGEHSGLYHRLAAALNAAGYRVWALDHPGHGLTPGTSEDVYDVFGLARNARALVRHVQCGSTEQLVLMGNSLGGVTAGLTMCTEDAPQIAGLVMTSTPLEPLKNIDELDQAIMSLEPTYLDVLETDPVLKQVVPLDYYKLDAGMTMAANVIKQRMPEWKFPVLMINGDADTLALPEDARRLAHKIPHARAATIRNSHHDVLNDVNYDAVAQLILQFLFETTNENIMIS